MNILTPQMLLIAPRIFMTFLSFIADYSIYRIASMCYIYPWKCVEIFASSYIMLVYSTRTFSNTIELILQCVLLWRVCESMVDSSKVIRKQNILQDLYDSAYTIQDKVKLVRMKTKLAPYNFTDSFLISFIVTYGTFVRPTFIAFSFIPISYWLQRGIVTKEVDFSYFHLRCLSLLPGIIITSLTCIFADSLYYGSVEFMDLVKWNVTSLSFVVTPINFLMYNSDTSHLSEHGLHPNYLHLIVNIPLLHGVLGFIGLWSVSKYVTRLIIYSIAKKPNVFSMATMLLGTFIFPVLILSLVPHQEPRFLLPTLPPLVLLYSDKIVLLSLPRFRFTRHFFFLMWHVWNIFCVFLFGFFHQGGVVKSLLHIHGHVATRYPHSNLHVVFSHMYMPPTFLLLRNNTEAFGVSPDGRRYKIPKTINTHDISSSYPVDGIIGYIHAIYKETLTQPHLENHTAVFVLCIPASLSESLYETKPSNVTLQRLVRLPGHLTLEDPPDFRIDEVKLTPNCGKQCKLLQRLDEFSIDIFKVKFTNSTTETGQH
ncbi:GPI mannosyltransferase 4-like isoform X2 [Oratosquilla oratoria]